MKTYLVYHAHGEVWLKATVQAGDADDALVQAELDLNARCPHPH